MSRGDGRRGEPAARCVYFDRVPRCLVTHANACVDLLSELGAHLSANAGRGHALCVGVGGGDQRQRQGEDRSGQYGSAAVDHASDAPLRDVDERDSALPPKR